MEARDGTARIPWKNVVGNRSTQIILYSTLKLPHEIDSCGVGWWYVGPRNGHVSIFSKQALATVWGRYEYMIVSLQSGRPLRLSHAGTLSFDAARSGRLACT